MGVVPILVRAVTNPTHEPVAVDPRARRNSSQRFANRILPHVGLPDRAVRRVPRTGGHGRENHQEVVLGHVIAVMLVVRVRAPVRRVHVLAAPRTVHRDLVPIINEIVRRRPYHV